MSRNLVTDEKIVTYPNSALTLVPNIFVIFVLIGVSLLAGAVGTNIWAIVIPVLILIILVIASLNIYSKKIVFDRPANKVFSKSLLSNKTYGISELHWVTKVNSTGSKDYYILTTKSDPYGQGIKLTNKIAFGNKELDEFEKNILPAVRTFINQTENIAAENQSSAAEFTQLSTYKKTAHDFYFYDVNTLLIILGAALFGLSVWWIYNFDVSNLQFFLQNPKYPTPLLKFLSPLLLLFSLASFGRGVLRIRVNPRSNLVIKEYLFGVFKKNYKIKTPVECFIQSNRQNGRHTETDVRISVTNYKENSIILRHFYKTKDVEQFITETKQILASALLN